MRYEADLEVRRAVEARTRAFETAFNAQDAVGLVAAYFVSDALGPMACPPGAPPIRGRAALISMYSAQMAAVAKIRLDLVELSASGDLAFELGRAFATMSDGIAMVGRYTVCWVKEGTEWRARIDFFAVDGWKD
jgi:ketosteroid isomerase-like protein